MVTAARVLGCLLASLALAALGAAETTVLLKLPDPLIGELVVEGALVIENPPARVARVELPEVPGLAWSALAGGSHLTRIVNGVTTTSHTVRLSLRAARLGPLAIPPVAVVLADGSTLRSQPLTVTVVAPGAGLDGEASAEAHFEPASIVPGEPTTLVLRIALRRGEVVEPLLGPPDQAIVLGERTLSEGIASGADGSRWRTLTARWPVTFANPGSYRVAGQQSYVVEVADDFSFLGRRVKRQVAVKPATLTVEALPSAGRPADFGGLIGPATISARLERERIVAGEGTGLVLTISGRQVELAARPVLPAVPGLRAYPRETVATPAPDGARSFAWDLVPAGAGEYAIPAIALPYFDPASRTYRRAASEPLALAVLPGRTQGLVVTGRHDQPASAPPPNAPPGLPEPLRGSAQAAPTPRTAWLLAALGLLLGLGAGLAGRWRARAPRPAHRGRALGRALRGGDTEAVAAALAALRPALVDADQRQAADALGRAVDEARFGGRALDPDAGRLAAVLEGVA